MKKVMILVFAALLAMSFSLAAEERSGPVISDLKVDPLSGPPGTVYTISIRIVSPRNTEDIVLVLHQVRENMESIDVPIRDDGLEGDAVKGDRVYAGRSVVPRTAAKRIHRFELFIQDKAGRKSNVLEYRFTVLKGEAI
jgi:hypothetical protein